MGSHEAISLFNDADHAHQQLNNTGEYMVPLEVRLVTDLGPNNMGSLGPVDKAGVAESRVLIEDLARPEYSRPASNRWICVDGRSSAEEVENADNNETADPQIGGSIPVSEAAASFMDDPASHQPLSTAIAIKTRSAVADGLEVFFHGDTHAGLAGCAANAKMRTVLSYTVANADIIIPTVWQLLEAVEISDSLDQDDLLQFVVNANHAVENDELWDITPEKVVEIGIENGAEYMVLQGFHGEEVTRADMSDGAFAKAAYVRDHATDERSPQSFSGSFGAYAKETLRRGELHGRSRHESALLIGQVFMYNIALTKFLKNDKMLVGVLKPAN